MSQGQRIESCLDAEDRFLPARFKAVLFTFAGTIMPSHDYIYYAHSAVGRDLRELQVGAYWAKLLDKDLGVLPQLRQAVL